MRDKDIRSRTIKEIKAQMRMWRIAKSFVDKEYPHVNVTLVNPLGLQGLGWREMHI